MVIIIITTTTTTTTVIINSLRYLFSENIVSENIFDACEIVGPSNDLHPECRADQLDDGTQLLHVKMNGHQEKHGTEG